MGANRFQQSTYLYKCNSGYCVLPGCKINAPASFANGVLLQLKHKSLQKALLLKEEVIPFNAACAFVVFRCDHR